MKKVALVLMAVVLVASVAMSQDVMPAAAAGAKSLNFTFGGLGTFGIGAAGAGGGLGISYFLDKDAALRLGLNVGVGSTSTPAAVTGNSEAKSSTMDVALGVDYLMYSGTGRLRPYMGAGINVGFGSSTTEPSVTPALNGEVTKTTNTRGVDGVGFGLSGIIGAEWFMYNEISLSAEYMPALVSIRTKADSETSIEGLSPATAKGGSSTSILGFGATALHLHIYW